MSTPIQAAAYYLFHADAVLVCAGAGMSVKPGDHGENVYISENDFAKHYPWFLRYGYKTSYEAMGLMADPDVPYEAKWALWAKHMMLQRYTFTPNDGYTALKELLTGKDTFVYTSNVDGAFERAGFDTAKLCTVQGDWSWCQCIKPCSDDSVFPSKPIIESLVPLINSETGKLPPGAAPKCPKCGGPCFGNVRGGDWFLTTPYRRQNDALRGWIADNLKQQKRLVILEIGAGFNTPTVTRFPMEAIVAQFEESVEADKTKKTTTTPTGAAIGMVSLVRLNPTEAFCNLPLKAFVPVNSGWDALILIGRAVHALKEASSQSAPPSPPPLAVPTVTQEKFYVNCLRRWGIPIGESAADRLLRGLR
jgi:NAD-dependent SIR2 family protein deacetylase